MKTVWPIGRADHLSAADLAREAVQVIAQYKTPRALVLDRHGLVSVCLPSEALDRDLVGVYSASIGLRVKDALGGPDIVAMIPPDFAQVRDDLQAAIGERRFGFKPRHRHCVFVGRKRKEAA